MWSRTIPCNDPAQLAKRISHRPGFVWLDSGTSSDLRANQSFLYCDPVASLRIEQGSRNDPEMCQRALQTVQAWLDMVGINSEGGHGGAGGVVAYLSYDFGSGLLPVATSRHERGAGPLAEFRLYDTVSKFDHSRTCVEISSIGLEGMDAKPSRSLALKKLAAIEHAFGEEGGGHTGSSGGLNWKPLMTRQDYQTVYDRVIQHILDGDIYQANLAQIFTCALPNDFDDFGYYLSLRERNPAPFSAFARFGDIAIASTSPERLFCMNDQGRIEVRPIKGTIKRSEDKWRDRELARQLENSRKDRAENMMIVDLLRNDLSKVCDPKSIEVESLCGVESYAGLHHLTSVIRGQLSGGKKATDVLSVVFPGGSITGAPKARAVEIIDSLERAGRGAFCGTIGHFTFDGCADFNILIRTVELGKGQAQLHVGGGITLLSNSQGEYEETLLKASHIISAQPGLVSGR